MNAIMSYYENEAYMNLTAYEFDCYIDWLNEDFQDEMEYILSEEDDEEK